MTQKSIVRSLLLLLLSFLVSTAYFTYGRLYGPRAVILPTVQEIEVSDPTPEVVEATMEFVEEQGTTTLSFAPGNSMIQVTYLKEKRGEIETIQVATTTLETMNIIQDAFILSRLSDTSSELNASVTNPPIMVFTFRTLHRQNGTVSGVVQVYRCSAMSCSKGMRQMQAVMESVSPLPVE